MAALVLPMLYLVAKILIECPEQRPIALGAFCFVALLLLGLKLMDSK